MVGMHLGREAICCEASKKQSTKNPTKKGNGKDWYMVICFLKRSGFKFVMFLYFPLVAVVGMADLNKFNKFFWTSLR